VTDLVVNKEALLNLLTSEDHSSLSLSSLSAAIALGLGYLAWWILVNAGWYNPGYNFIYAAKGLRLIPSFLFSKIGTLIIWELVYAIVGIIGVYSARTARLLYRVSCTEFELDPYASDGMGGLQELARLSSRNALTFGLVALLIPIGALRASYIDVALLVTGMSLTIVLAAAPLSAISTTVGLMKGRVLTQLTEMRSEARLQLQPVFRQLKQAHAKRQLSQVLAAIEIVSVIQREIDYLDKKIRRFPLDPKVVAGLASSILLQATAYVAEIELLNLLSAARIGLQRG
jgi:hypothetical protein